MALSETLQKHLSYYAGRNPDELVAEARSYLTAGHPISIPEVTLDNLDEVHAFLTEQHAK